jgi:hypothetical protein
MTLKRENLILFFMTLLLGSCQSGSGNYPPITLVVVEPTPYLESTGGRGTFSPYNANSVAPEAILEEVGYFATGGPTTCFTASEPQVQDMPENVVWFQTFALITCGWTDGEEVNVTLIDPSGNSVSERSVARMDTMDISPGVMYFITPSSVGQYQFIFEGDSTTLNITIPVYKPFSPRMYVSNDKNQVVLYSLSSKKNISLFAYSTDTVAGKLNFSAWQKFQADTDGTLVIDIPDSNFTYFAVGDVTGYLQEAGSNPRLDGSSLR